MHSLLLLLVVLALAAAPQTRKPIDAKDGDTPVKIMTVQVPFQ